MEVIFNNNSNYALSNLNKKQDKTQKKTRRLTEIKTGGPKND